MSFTGKPSLTHAVPITNDGFWPEISMSELMSSYRIPSEYADDVIKTGLTMAIVRVNEILRRARTFSISLGFDTAVTFDGIDDSEVGSAQAVILNYNHAVFCRAKAGLLMQFNSLNRNKNAINEGKESESTQDYWLGESNAAIKAVYDEIMPENTVMSNGNGFVVMI